MPQSLSVLSDAPVSYLRDELKFRRYVDPLIDIITSPRTETPFTVGVFGAWGSGKSSLLTMVDHRLAKDHPDAYVRVKFNPWMHRREPNMLVPLLHTLHETLATDPGKRFAEFSRQLWQVLVRLGADVLLKRLTANAVTLSDIEGHAQRYAEQRGRVQSETRNLRTVLTDNAAALGAAGVRLVFFIDDLDRCEPNEMIDLLESLKLFLDVPNVVVVLAIAKDLVDRGVAIRYKQFGFEDVKVLSVSDEYLDKMIQLPLYLLPLDDAAVGHFMHALKPPPAVAKHIDLLRRVVAPNPRRIKRVLNMCAVTNAIVAASPQLANLRGDLVVRLAVLRVQSAELYASVLTYPRLLVALELRYQSKLAPSGFAERFGATDADALRELSARYHDSQPYLRHLFAESSFADVEPGDLATYLTLLGG